jgi:hypothetical protein
MSDKVPQGCPAAGCHDFERRFRAAANARKGERRRRPRSALGLAIALSIPASTAVHPEGWREISIHWVGGSFQPHVGHSRQQAGALKADLADTAAVVMCAAGIRRRIVALIRIIEK